MTTQHTIESGLLAKVDSAAGFIRQKTSVVPKIGIILGTGLGQLVNKVKGGVKIAYEDIPHFPRTTVESHAGRFHIGELSGKPVAMMEGRFHFYEGYSLEEVTFPVRVMKALGAEMLIISNAAGGLNPNYKKGDLVFITDHINFMGVNPLVGPNDNRLGIRFPDMIEPYSARLIKIAHKAAVKLEVRVQTRASRNAVLKLGGHKFKVYVTVPPESGRANRAVIELLSEYFGLSGSCFEIVRGETARDKIISIKKE